MCQGWDKELAHGGISPIFDKEKEQKRLQEVQLIGQIGNQAADIARTQGEINGLNAGKKALAKEGIPEPDVNASDEEKARYQTQLRNSAAYKTEQAKYGTGSDIQRGIQAAVGALQGLAGGDIGAALAGASAPELANIIGHKAGLGEDDIAAKAIAHAILGGAAAAMQGNNAAAGAAGAAAGELAANAILKTMYPGKHVSELDESDRQLVSNLATIASGLAGNLAGGDSKSTTTGAQSGKNAVENNYLSLPNGMMNYGQAVASWNQYAVDNNLTQEQTQEGLNRIAIGEGASWGTEYKVKPYVKGEVAGGAGAGYYFDTSIDPYQISANRGETLAVGGRISGQIGIQFGPYFPGTMNSERNSSIGLGLGVISSEVSYGKDGFGFSFGVGPAWGWSGVSTNIAGEKVDINGSSGTEFYHHDFGQDKAK